jgi:hypothetical protein
MTIQSKQILTSEITGLFDEFCKNYEVTDVKIAMKKACQTLRLNSKIDSTPVQLQNILSHCNAKLVEKELSTNGRLDIGDNCYRVLVQNNLPVSIKRFTIAHEIGHIILTDVLANNPSHLRKTMLSSSWESIEKLCDYAAAQILVPDEDFVESIGKFGLTTEGIEKIRNQYQVSYEVIFRKFVDIFSPSAIILWKSRGTGLVDEIAPRIIRYPYSTIPGIPIEEDSIGTPRQRSVVRVAISKGSAWVNSIKCQIDGKEQPIIAYAFPLKEKNYFTKVRVSDTILGKYEEKVRSYYDVIMFYLPTELIYKTDALQKALGIE